MLLLVQRVQRKRASLCRRNWATRSSTHTRTRAPRLRTHAHMMARVGQGMLGSRQPSALGRGGRAAPMPDVSRGTPARRWGQGVAFTKQARDRTRRLLALALQPGRLLHASRTAPRERGQLTGKSQRGGRLALGQASATYRFFNTLMGRACLARARRRASCKSKRRDLTTSEHDITESRGPALVGHTRQCRAPQGRPARPTAPRTRPYPELRTEVCVFWVSHAPSRACIPRNAQLKSHR